MKKLELLVPPPFIAILSMVMAWALNNAFPEFKYDFTSFKIAGIMIASLGFSFSITGVLSFKRRKTSTNPTKPEDTVLLVTQGIYRFTRNPMYLGLFLVIVGWAFYIGNFLSGAGAVFFLVYITQFQIKPEEQVLEKKFGNTYKKYFESVNRWI